MNYSELLQLAKGWSNLVSNRIIIWRLLYINKMLTEKYDELYKKMRECEEDKNCDEDLVLEAGDRFYEASQALMDFQKHNFK